MNSPHGGDVTGLREDERDEFADLDREQLEALTGVLMDANLAVPSFIAPHLSAAVLRSTWLADLLAADFGHCGERGRCLLTIRSVEHDLGMDA